MPGNHDVDREIAKRTLTNLLHNDIRAKYGPEIDTVLEKILSDEQSASTLLAPLKQYNIFAARFQCSVSADKPYWERDLVLSCGTVFRLRGLCSTLVSNADDKRDNMVLGTAQVSVPRKNGVEYLTLCHHPPDWLKDHDTVLNHLESKVRVQLFGHKHSQRVQKINGNLRITAGAMHPERRERNWEPIYNVLHIERVGDQRIDARLYRRRWNKTDSCFVMDPDSDTGLSYSVYHWETFPMPVRIENLTDDASEIGQSEHASTGDVPTKELTKESDAMPPNNHKRRLTYRFLTLPFRHQIEVAQRLNLITESDRDLGNEALVLEFFKRAVDKGLLSELWRETEKRHADSATFDPFEISK